MRKRAGWNAAIASFGEMMMVSAAPPITKGNLARAVIDS